MLDLAAGECMTREPKVIAPDQFAATALALMEEKKITSLMVVDPKLTPVSCGCLLVVVRPSGINTLEGAMVAFDGSLLLSVTKTPPASAGLASVNWKFTC